MKKNRYIVALLYAGSDWEKSQPFSNELQRKRYEDFYTLANNEYDIQCIRVAIEWFDGKAFKKYWTFTHGKWKKMNKAIVPDLIHNKASFRYEALPLLQSMCERFLVVNPWELEMQISDKLFPAIAFPDLVPPTYAVNTEHDLVLAVKKIPTKKIIVKPRFGHSGLGIQIVDRHDIATLRIGPHMIVQSFINSRAGIPGVYKGIHDLRCIVVGGRVVLTYIRAAKTNQLLCNVSQGAELVRLRLNQLPSSVRSSVQIIQNRFSIFPHAIFMIDFFFFKNKPLLIEMNTGINIYWPKEFDKEFYYLAHTYLQYFTELIEQKTFKVK
ncbi:MAG: hypothetical protein HYV32_01245 [Candidatus Kerfeldbacteria bacterium]|nr:hypothetical protein [Candidatus Kerfeldbacteria bacterium]